MPEAKEETPKQEKPDQKVPDSQVYNELLVQIINYGQHNLTSYINESGDDSMNQSAVIS